MYRSLLVAQRVKNLPAMKETWVQSLGWNNPLEKGMAAHSSILAWRIPWTDELGGIQPMGSQRVRHDWVIHTHTHTHTHTLCIKLNGHMEICQVYSRAIKIMFFKGELPLRHYLLNVSGIVLWWHESLPLPLHCVHRNDGTEFEHGYFRICPTLWLRKRHQIWTVRVKNTMIKNNHTHLCSCCFLRAEF